MTDFTLQIPKELRTFDEMDVDEKLSYIESQISVIKDKMIETEEMIQKVIAEVQPILAEVLPMIQNLTDNPMVRMMLKGKK